MTTSADCPVCLRGKIVDKRCERCKVGIAEGSGSGPVWFYRKPRRRQDQDKIGPYLDYARTKEDKQ